MLRGVVYRLIEYLASMGHSSIWKLICAISVSNILTVGVHLSSTPSISGPRSATEDSSTSTDGLLWNYVDLKISISLSKTLDGKLHRFQLSLCHKHVNLTTQLHYGII